jgi:antitoxin (DNA-binding transcriptional repressor) of toxin-antitoxin stability system
MAMMTVDAADADLNALLDKAAQGDVVVIERAGREVARLTVTGRAQPLDAPQHGKRKINFGWAKDIVTVSDDFDDPLPWDEWLNDPDDPLSWPPDRTS